MDERLAANRANWDDRTGIHLRSRFYDNDWPRAAPGPGAWEIEMLGDVRRHLRQRGRSVLAADVRLPSSRSRSQASSTTQVSSRRCGTRCARQRGRGPIDAML